MKLVPGNRRLKQYLLPWLRLVSLLLLATVGTVLLVRSAPGYFSRSGEVDGQHSETVRRQLEAQQQGEGTPLQASLHFAGRLMHGDLGRSQQYGVEVSGLLLPRLRVTARVLLPAVLLSPLLALLCALPCSQLRGPVLERAAAAATLLGIAVPVSVLGGASLLSGLGGPAAVLLAVVAARDFRFFTRLLRRQSRVPYLLYARAYGSQPLRATAYAVLLPVCGEMFSLLALSLITALGSIVPVEVIFGVPGVGQMAWNAAMNRDLPVLLAVTLVMALCIGVATLLTNRNTPQQVSGVAA